jgi:hypothetical protein
MSNIYYRFERVENASDSLKMVLTAIFEPEPMDYMRSFFGIFSPWPATRERQVEFYTNDDADTRFRRANHSGVVWYEQSSETPCSPEMCEMLETFYRLSQEKPGTTLIGRP